MLTFILCALSFALGICVGLWLVGDALNAVFRAIEENPQLDIRNMVDKRHLTQYAKELYMLSWTRHWRRK